MKNIVQIVLLSGSLVVAHAQGSYEALLAFSNSPSVGAISGTGGWSFTPQISIEVTDLGCLDQVVTAQGPIDIGLWTDTGTMVASAQVAPTNTLVNFTRYATIAPIFLTGGTTYRIGAYSPSGSINLYPVGPSWGGSSSVSSDINLGALAVGTGGFVFPSALGAGGTMLLGSNFRYDRIPEPATSAFLVLGLFLLCARKRR